MCSRCMVDKESQDVIDTMSEIENMIPSNLSGNDVVPEDVVKKMQEKARGLLNRLSDTHE